MSIISRNIIRNWIFSRTMGPWNNKCGEQSLQNIDVSFFHPLVGMNRVSMITRIKYHFKEQSSMLNHGSLRSKWDNAASFHFSQRRKHLLEYNSKDKKLLKTVQLQFSYAYVVIWISSEQCHCMKGVNTLGILVSVSGL